MPKRISKHLKFLKTLDEAINTDRKVNPNPKFAHRKDGEPFVTWVEDACWDKLRKQLNQ